MHTFIHRKKNSQSIELICYIHDKIQTNDKTLMKRRERNEKKKEKKNFTKQ